MVGSETSVSTPFGSFLKQVGAELASSRQPRARPRRAPSIEWRQLREGITPYPGESLRGLVARACARNLVPSSWGILQYLGLANRNRVIVSEDPNINPAELAYAMRVPDAEVRARRYQQVGSRDEIFFGLTLPKAGVDSRVRHFSPAALRQAAYHRAVWELKDVPFSLETWDMLQHSCWCTDIGVSQGWTRTATQIHECDACGDPLTDLEPIPVPPEMRTALAILGALIDPDPAARLRCLALLPTKLREVDRSTLFRMIQDLAKAIDPDAAQHSIEEPHLRLHALWKACCAVQAYPEGFATLSWHERTTSSTIARLLRSWILLDPVAHLDEDGRARPRNTDMRTKDGRAIVGIQTAASIAGVTGTVLTWARENGHLTPHHQSVRGILHPAFLRIELQGFGSAWLGRQSAQSLAHELNVSRHGVEQFVALGLLKASAPSLPGTGPYFHHNDVEAFIDVLERAAANAVTEPIPLADAMLLIGGRQKPWGPIFQLLISGQVPFALRQAGSVADCLMIPVAKIGLIRDLVFNRQDHPDFDFADRMNQRDALECLNATTSSIRMLDGLPSAGINPKTFGVRDIEERAAAYISTKEIAAHLGISAHATFYRLRKEGYCEIMPACWPRDTLAKLAC